MLFEFGHDLAQRLETSRVDFGEVTLFLLESFEEVGAVLPLLRQFGAELGL